eukprot:365559-Chlamydomonas_euryale.AAC.4
MATRVADPSRRGDQHNTRMPGFRRLAFWCNVNDVGRPAISDPPPMSPRSESRAHGQHGHPRACCVCTFNVSTGLGRFAHPPLQACLTPRASLGFANAWIWNHKLKCIRELGFQAV